MSTVPDNTIKSVITGLPGIARPSEETEPALKRRTREEYYRLGEQGWFYDQRVELIDGEIIISSPQSPQHVAGSHRVRRLLEQAIRSGYWIRPFGPLTKDDYSEPEPDISVVRGSIEDYDNEHPITAVLVVEVSRISFRYDTNVKNHLYASMGIQDYWVLDLPDRRLLVHREPVVDESLRFGHRYKTIETINDAGSIVPLELPGVTLAVSDMLPPT